MCQIHGARFAFPSQIKKPFDVNQSPASMPHGKMQMIKVQISPCPPCRGFIWSLRQKMQPSRRISIKIYSYFRQTLFPAPLKTSPLWSPLMAFIIKVWRLTRQTPLWQWRVYSYVNTVHIIFLLKPSFFQGMFNAWVFKLGKCVLADLWMTRL